MGLFDTVKHYAAQPIGWGARALGSAQNLLPGQGDSSLNQVGRAITNPNVNGNDIFFRGAEGGQAPGGSTGGTNGGYYPQQTLGAETNSPYGAGGGAGGIDAGYRNGLADKLRNIMSAYDSLSGGVDTVSNDAVGNYQKQYDQQAGDLNNEFTKTGNQLSGIYGARGLADSSYYGNAQDEAKNTYNTNVQSLLDQRNQNLATIGQQAQQAKAGYASNKGQYAGILGNLNNYDQAGLSSLDSNLTSAQAGIQQAQAGQGTQGSFINAIQGLPALQQNGSSQLQAQLQKLMGTGAPGFAKNQVAQGLIQQAGLQDPNQANVWQNYWNQLQGA